MGKLIRPTYPTAFSVGLLCLIFGLAFFLAQQIFKVSFSELNEKPEYYVGMFLAALAVLIMVLILWEEILFPIKIKEVNGEIEFRNHSKKIQTQLIIYCTIPAIFIFLFFEYEINVVRFVIWAAVCLAVPIAEKIASGVKNYNDFLRLTDDYIEYKDNELEGRFETKNIQQLTLLTDEDHVTNQLLILFKNGDSVTIDIHDMELDAYYDIIHTYMFKHYGHMTKEEKI